MTPFREVAALAMYEWNYKYSMGEGEAARQKAREDAEKMSFEEIRDSINSDSIDLSKIQLFIDEIEKI